MKVKFISSLGGQQSQYIQTTNTTTTTTTFDMNQNGHLMNLHHIIEKL